MHRKLPLFEQYIGYQKSCRWGKTDPKRGDVLHILILFPFGKEENDGNDRCEDFRDGDRVPDAVHIKQKRQKNDGGRLEHQRAQNEIAAEISPLPSAVKNDEAKMLNPANKNA